MTSARRNRRHNFSEYTRITSFEQREQYIDEFYKVYKEYIRVNSKIEGATARLDQLGDILEMTDPCDQKFDEIHRRIQRKTTRHQEIIQHCNYLQRKMACISSLLTTFDSRLINVRRHMPRG